jgi:uncharacterized surface protein with fasciclin (FAS1) repeats
MNLFKYVLFLTVLIFSTALTSCYDNMNERFKTFEEETVATYLESHPEQFSEYLKLVKANGMYDLLNAYGAYTCFAPTNAAMQSYYAERGASFETLHSDTINEIVHNSLLRIKLISSDFPEGAVQAMTMDSRYLYINIIVGNETPQYVINKTSHIISLDREVHNGVIHTIDQVLPVFRDNLPSVISADPRFSLFNEALTVTGLVDSLQLLQELGYVPYIAYVEAYTYTYGSDLWNTPPSWRYGYTALIESDSTYAVNGIHNLDEMRDYARRVYSRVYPEDTDVSDETNPRNYLNRFVGYHLMDRELAANEFIHPKLVQFYVRGNDMVTYMTTYCRNSLLECVTGTLFNRRRDGSAIRIISPDHTALNGVFHEIDNILVFDEGVINDVLNKRIRFDSVDLFPELATNKVRGNEATATPGTNSNGFWFPRGYIKNITYSENCDLVYSWNYPGTNYRGDEMKIAGSFDFTVTMPAVPAGTYEIRIGYSANSYRGVLQIYFDGKPCGIPLDMTIGPTDSRIGWLADNSTEDNGVENDKMMHNRGYMKGPESMFCNNFTSNHRANSSCMRKVLAQRSFQKMEPHYLRIKSVQERSDREYMLDYIELIPLMLLETEGRD